MSEKCFCHLNGFKVKDAEAQRRIEQLERTFDNAFGANSQVEQNRLDLIGQSERINDNAQDITELEDRLTDLEESVGGSGDSKLYIHRFTITAQKYIDGVVDYSSPALFVTVCVLSKRSTVFTDYADILPYIQRFSFWINGTAKVCFNDDPSQSYRVTEFAANVSGNNISVHYLHNGNCENYLYFETSDGFVFSITNDAVREVM